MLIRYKFNKKIGFTLIELLVTVSVIAVLLLMAIPKYIDSTKGSKIRVFENNARTLISDINTSYMNNHEKVDKIYDEVIERAQGLKDRPEKAIYNIDKTTGILECTLKKEVFDGNDDYVIKYYPTIQKITQSPSDLPSGAVNLSVN